jgi:hypothetical protein
MSSGVKVCLDRQILGECTKKQDCPVCNSSFSDVNNITNSIQNMGINVNELNLNKNAKGYVPKSKRIQEGSSNQQVNSENKLDDKLNLNLMAKEYIPKSIATQNQITYTPEYFEDDNDEEYAGEEFYMIMKDIIDNEVMEELEEEDEADEDRWFPKYKDCECCKGFVYKCKGVACEFMDACYCKMKDECDDEEL